MQSIFKQDQCWFVAKNRTHFYGFFGKVIAVKADQPIILRRLPILRGKGTKPASGEGIRRRHQSRTRAESRNAWRNRGPKFARVRDVEVLRLGETTKKRRLLLYGLLASNVGHIGACGIGAFSVWPFLCLRSTPRADCLVSSKKPMACVCYSRVCYSPEVAGWRS